MEDQDTDLLVHIEGLQKVEPEALAEFKREMTENVIPEIKRVVEERRMLAAESRQRDATKVPTKSDQAK